VVGKKTSGLEDTAAAGTLSEGADDVAHGDTLQSSPGGKTAAAGTLDVVDPGRYEHGKELARGGMGRIRIARDRRLDRDVAIKELLHDSPSTRTRFDREIRITARLQHPAIVNVLEAGQWPNGEPFYVMKLVDGESLDRAIARCASFEQRLGLLPNVTTVVEALAFAHSRRILHRDLKPANVLVGAFGETVVIDWGLAKAFDEADSAPRVPVAGPDSQTIAGTVIGTPAYMAPEQAAGKTVDARADVYALGGMLYHLLAGKQPFSGTTVEAVLDKVGRGERRRLEVAAPGTPPDLVAIVEKAMALAPEDRYATAAELAADLRRFQTGQLVAAHRYSTWQLVRRWVRRHRAAVAVGGVMLVALAVTLAVSMTRILAAKDHANAQRALAEASQRESEDLLGFMLTDLRDRLLPLGKLDVLDTVAQKAIAYFSARPAADDDGDLARRATAIASVADISHARGKTEEALAQHRAALAIREGLVARHPGDDQLERDLCASRNKLAKVLLDRGDTAAALAETSAAITLAKSHVGGTASTASPAWLLVAGDSFHLHGTALTAKGDRPGTLAAAREALALAQAHTASAPAEPEPQRRLAIAHTYVAEVLETQGESAASEAELRTAIAISERLAARAPDNQTYAHDLAAFHDQLGALLEARPDLPGALAAYRTLYALDKKLVALDPTNAKRQRGLALAHSRIGNVLVAQGAIADGLAELRASLAIRTRLAELDPKNTAWQRDLSVIHQRIAEVHKRQGALDEALAGYRASLAITDRLLALDATNTTWVRDSKVLHSRIADVLLRKGDADGALAEKRLTLQITERLAAKDPKNAAWQLDLLAAHVGLADHLAERKDHAAALAELELALPIAERRAAIDAKDKNAALGPGIVHLKVGTILWREKKLAEARARLERGLETATRVLASDPANPNAASHAADLHETLAGVEIELGEHAAADTNLRAALALRQGDATKDPSDASAQVALAGVHQIFGDLARAQKQPARALESYRAALAMLEAVQAKNASDQRVAKDVAALRALVATCCR